MDDTKSKPKSAEPSGDVISLGMDASGNYFAIARRPIASMLERHGDTTAKPAPSETADNDADPAGRRKRQKEDNARIQEISAPVAPVMTVEQMIANAVWIADGSQVGFLDNPGQVLSYHDFAGLTAASASEVSDRQGKPRTRQNAELWKGALDRKTVHTRTFHAGADLICRDPDGHLAINSWRPFLRRPSSRDVSPFLDQVRYLFPDAWECKIFLDWLAHIEQRPGELPHYGWLHIAKSTGTGRNWLASVLSRLWRGYVAPNVDLPALLSSQFNGSLGGRVVAIVDEVQEGGGENPYRHMNRLKSLVNAEHRDINPKYGRQYREHNACRWLVFSNHDNALPLTDTDRRWRVVRHEEAPRSEELYAKLYRLIGDEAFINSVGAWLGERDLSAFNPGERPPMNEAKEAAVSASRSPLMQNAEQLVRLWPADVATNATIAAVLSEGGPTLADLTPGMRAALRDVGAINTGKVLTVHGERRRGWVLRNVERWKDASTSDLSDEASRAAGFPLEVLQRAQEATAGPF